MIVSAETLTWQPIETAPKDGTPVLLYRECAGWSVRGWGYWVDVKGIDGWVSHGFGDPPGNLGLGHPTHWMPLPEPPALSAARGTYSPQARGAQETQPQE